MKNEQTGPRAKSLAGKLQRKLALMEKQSHTCLHDCNGSVVGTINDFQTVIASALNQAPANPDKPHVHKWGPGADLDYERCTICGVMRPMRFDTPKRKKGAGKK